METVDFKVGDRVRWKHSDYQYDLGNYATVTELTERGFKWKLDRPVCIHPLYGSYQEGECLAPEYWERVTVSADAEHPK